MEFKTSSANKKNSRKVSPFQIPDDSVLASYL